MHLTGKSVYHDKPGHSSPHNRYTAVMKNVMVSDRCPIYRVPEHSSCRGMSRRMQAIKLPYSGTP